MAGLFFPARCIKISFTLFLGIMIKKTTGLFLAFLFVVIVLGGFYLLNLSSQTVIFGQEKIVYNLPYPGLLPDHPVYPIKAIRDRLVDFFTRDYIKKARLYLLYSDKRVNMALFLAKKGKNKLAVSSFSKGEKYFQKILPLLETSKKQGVSPPSDLIDNLKLSNAKHGELLDQLLKTLPQGQTEALAEVMRINQEIKIKLERL